MRYCCTVRSPNSRPTSAHRRTSSSPARAGAGSTGRSRCSRGRATEIGPDAAPARNADASGAGGGAVETAGSRKSIGAPAPLGSIRLRRGDHILASDGPLGRVQGLVVDRVEHHITHVLLGDNRARKRAAVLIGSVIDPIEAARGVRVDLTKIQAVQPATDRTRLPGMTTSRSAATSRSA